MTPVSTRPPDLPLAAVLLAAGRARRFGGRKLEARLDDGTPLGLAAWRTLAGVVPETLVVVRDDDTDFRALLHAAGAQLVVARSADRGMGASLAAGVSAIDPRAAMIIALADMPWVAASSVAAVAAAVASGASIAAPRYRGQRGHPIGFSPSHRAALLALDGDEGARSILVAHPDALRLIDVDDAGVIADVDTPEALRRS